MVNLHKLIKFAFLIGTTYYNRHCTDAINMDANLSKLTDQNAGCNITGCCVYRVNLFINLLKPIQIMHIHYVCIRHT